MSPSLTLRAGGWDEGDFGHEKEEHYAPGGHTGVGKGRASMAYVPASIP